MYQVRGDGASEDSREFWEQQMRVVTLLDQVRLKIEGMRAAGENVTVYDEAFPHWARAVFAPDIQWGQLSAGEVIDRRAIWPLGSLGNVLDREPAGPSLSGEDRQTIRDALDDLVALLGEDDCPLNQHQKAYVLRLVDAIRRLLEDVEVLGDADLAHHISDLYGFLTIIADALEPHARRFTDKLRAAAHLLIPGGYYALVVVNAGLGVVASVKAITS